MTLQERLCNNPKNSDCLEAADRIDADEALMRQALEALEWELCGHFGGQAAINALRARLEQTK
jgi:DNA recombination-dependent growth factor C